MQLSFKWPLRQSFAAQDFIVSPANAEAADFLQHWPTADSAHMAIISGPEACGKTHLAAGWAMRTGALILDRKMLGKVSSQELCGNATHGVLEDIHEVTRQEALFHLLRQVETHGLFLLLTTRIAPDQLHFTLADLRSRLLALPQAVIYTPDQELLKAYLFKCFADRQLHVSEEVAEYLVKRMERSFAAAYALVNVIEEKAAAQAVAITVPFVKNVLK